MNGYDRSQAFRLFEQALGLETSARPSFLNHRCDDNFNLRAEVEALLDAAAKDNIHTDMLLGSSPRVSESLVGRHFGRFRLLELIGEGGMGVVYRAERTDGIQQNVAIKLIADEFMKIGQERFKRETQLLARLEHPSIARLIDAGFDDGRAWIALEFVAGHPIDVYCDQHQLPLRDRVRLLADIAGAVAAAHRMLVVHRDIKPANVLVSADGAAKLIDFGIAAALQDSGSTHKYTTDVGCLFTPHYSAPEQVSGEPITVSTDVFGLGALGYRLLIGQTLYPQARGAVGYLLAVMQHEVDSPSRIALNNGDARLARQLRGDLDAILRKAVSRNPADRYASATDMQTDLHRYLNDLPVSARAPSLRVRVGKFVRRNAVVVGFATTLIIGLVGGGIAYGIQARHALEAREIAVKRGEFLQALLKSANPRGGNRDVTVAQVLDGSSKQIDSMLHNEPLVAASMLGLVAETNTNLGRFTEGLDANTRQIDILRTQHGSALELAEALSMHGELLINSGNDREAEAPLREALALTEHEPAAIKQLGAVLESLAKNAQNLGREDEAEALYKREIAVNKLIGNSIRGKAGFPYSGLATLRYSQGRYAEATAYVAQALQIERQYFPPDHPDLLDAEYNYAVALEANHEADKAEPLFRSLLASYRRILGPQHSDTYGAQQGLAHDLLSQGRYQEAANEAHEAAVGLSSTVGDADGWTDIAWGVYGLAACLAGHGAEGLAALHKTESLQAARTGANSSTTMSTSIHIGTCLVSLHRYTEAEPVLLNAVKALESLRGSTYKSTQAGYVALHELYSRTGRAEEAAQWQSKILTNKG